MTLEPTKKKQNNEIANDYVCAHGGGNKHQQVLFTSSSVSVFWQLNIMYRRHASEGCSNKTGPNACIKI